MIPLTCPPFGGVCARWRGLAPEPEPDLVLVVWDDPCNILYAVPRAHVPTPFLDRLRLESSQIIDNYNDDDGHNFRTMMDMCSDTVCDGYEITLHCLFANVRRGGRKAQLFDVEFDRDLTEYKVTRFETERDLAVNLMDWARSSLDMEEDGTAAVDIDTDEGLAVTSALLEEARRVWL